MLTSKVCNLWTQPSYFKNASSSYTYELSRLLYSNPYSNATENSRHITVPNGQKARKEAKKEHTADRNEHHLTTPVCATRKKTRNQPPCLFTYPLHPDEFAIILR